MKKVTRIVLFGISYFVGCGLALIVLSIIEAFDHTKTSNGTTMTGGSVDSKNPCDSAPFGSYKPSSFRYNDDTGALGCSWDVTSTVVRCILSFVITALSGFSFYVCSFRRTRWGYLLGILILGGAAAMGYLAIRDGPKVGTSRSWCTGGMAGVSWTGAKPTIHCDYTGEILVVFFDTLGTVACVATCVTSIMQVRARMSQEPGADDAIKDSLIEKQVLPGRSPPTERHLHDFASDRLTAEVPQADEEPPEKKWWSNLPGAKSIDRKGKKSLPPKKAAEGEIDFTTEAQRAQNREAEAEHISEKPASFEPALTASAKKPEPAPALSSSGRSAPRPAPQTQPKASVSSGEIDFSSVVEQQKKPAKVPEPSPERPPKSEAPRPVAVTGKDGSIDFAAIPKTKDQFF